MNNRTLARFPLTVLAALLPLSTTAAFAAQTQRQQLQAGKTMADLAKAKGVSLASIRAAALAALNTQLAAAVKAGQLTQAQANERLARAKADANFGLMAGPRGGRGGQNSARNGGEGNGPDNRNNNPDRPAGPRGEWPTDGA